MFESYKELKGAIKILEFQLKKLEETKQELFEVREKYFKEDFYRDVKMTNNIWKKPICEPVKTFTPEDLTFALTPLFLVIKLKNGEKILGVFYNKERSTFSDIFKFYSIFEGLGPQSRGVIKEEINIEEIEQWCYLSDYLKINDK